MSKKINILGAAAVAVVARPLATLAHPGHLTFQYGATHALLGPGHLLFVVIGGLVAAAFAHRLPRHARLARAAGVAVAVAALGSWLCLV